MKPQFYPMYQWVKSRWMLQANSTLIILLLYCSKCILAGRERMLYIVGKHNPLSQFTKNLTLMFTCWL